MDELGDFGKFLKRLQAHAIRKADMYDGVNRSCTIDRAIKLVGEEFGEINSALIRDRVLLAEEECLDVAHAVFLLWRAIRIEHNGPYSD